METSNRNAVEITKNKFSSPIPDFSVGPLLPVLLTLFHKICKCIRGKSSQILIFRTSWVDFHIIFDLIFKIEKFR